MGFSHPKDKKKSLEEKIVLHEAFKEFVKDFISQIRLHSLDSSTWYILYHQILEWYEEAAPITGISKEALKSNLADPYKFKKYLRQLSTESNKKFFSNFLAYRTSKLSLGSLAMPVTDNYIYQIMSQALGINIYYIDTELKKHIHKPKVELEEESLDENVKKYLKLLEKRREKMASTLQEGIQVYANVFDIYKFTPKSEKEKGNSYKFKPALFPSNHINSQLKNLLGIKKALMVLEEKKRSVVKFKPTGLEFWFPNNLLDQEKFTAAEALPIIDFAIKQIHYAKAYKYGRFMVGNYPENVTDARTVFTEKGQKNNQQVPMTKYYDKFKIKCGLIDDSTLRDALAKMFDNIYVVASKELLAKGKFSLQYIRAERMLSSLDSMASLAETNSINYKEMIIKLSFLTNIEQDAKKIERSYFFSFSNKKLLRQTLTNQRTALAAALVDKKPNYKLIKPEGAPNLFEKILQQKPKDPKKGKKPGGEFDMLGSDHQERTFMIKRGEGLGDTLSEYLAHLEFQESLEKGSEDIRTAVTHLVVEEKENAPQNIEEFSKNILVASEFSGAIFGIEAYKLAGFNERPVFGATLHGEMYTMLIELNKECELGLEYALNAAIKVSDRDFHTGNVMLNININAIEDNQMRELAIRLKGELEQLIEKNIKDPGKNIFANRKIYIKNLKDKIKALKQTGASVFFQKIDHGYAYYKYDTPLRLDTSSIFRAGQMTIGRRTNITPSFNPLATQPSNHISEFTGHCHAKKLLLSDRGCHNITNNNEETQLRQLNTALDKFFTDLHLAAAAYGKNPDTEKVDLKKQQEAEMYLLKSFYKHTTGKSFSGAASDINNIQVIIREHLSFHRSMQIEHQSKYYIHLLQTIKKEERTHVQENLLEYLILRKQAKSIDEYKLNIKEEYFSLFSRDPKKNI